MNLMYLAASAASGAYADDSAAEAALIVLGIMLIFLLAIFAFAVVSYVFNALGMYTIAKRRGIQNPWLAWIPVGNTWLLGTISDQYQYVANNKKTNRRKLLLWLTVGEMIAGVCYSGLAFLLEIAALFGGDLTILTMMGLCILLWVCMTILSILLMIFTYIALFDLFKSCHPDNAVLYLVLSIVISVTLPFLIFACRKSDKGMPVKAAAAPALEERTATPAEETPAEAVAPETTPSEE